MKFALVNGLRLEAQPNLLGTCPACQGPMIAKCGEVKVWHWAHRGKRSCDPWWENETEWHRVWKDVFPAEWQEVVHTSETGEKHIADVETDRGWVIEFQHSYLRPEERRSRDSFYRKLIWVVDGTRRKRDRSQLFNAWAEGVPVGADGRVRRIISDDSALVSDWIGSVAPIFFDFGEPEQLWWLFAKAASGSAYVGPFPRVLFIDSHRYGATKQAAQGFDDFVVTFPKQLAEFESLVTRQFVQRAPRQLVPNRSRRRRF